MTDTPHQRGVKDANLTPEERSAIAGKAHFLATALVHLNMDAAGRRRVLAYLKANWAGDWPT